ncbi:FAD:protein FMN transferase [Azomonas macrocytogenes]|uniref:FAD:protein FMN transferase n=1 Tax=Azomonas macrocytogenes TaxID=69962 RepID=A0A839SYG2_AZOMA|nr:FAD:protein FMN transferase [Azomonas macrocytogenes]MBB3101739.1 thiamine biosynthesis lipoprotein [Azomonas macrocytogenes]
MNKTRWRPVTILVLATLVVGCFRQDKVEEFVGLTMGSTYSIKYVRTEATPEPTLLKRETEAILAGIDKDLSTYRPDSAIQKFNALPAGSCENMPESVLKLVTVGEQLAIESDGALDLTVEPLLELWGFGPHGRVERLPTAEQIAKVRQRVDHRYLHIDHGRLCKDIELQVDFNSIAAGYAVDLVVAHLEALGVKSYLVEITGELRAQGKKPDGSSWRVAIEAPRENERSLQEVIELDGYSISTSGDYRNYYEENGKRYSHTLDPQTGAPITHKLAAVTVAEPSAMRADGLSTTLMVMGPERGFDFATQKGIAALFVTHGDQGFVAQHTEAFDRLFAIKDKK